MISQKLLKLIPSFTECDIVPSEAIAPHFLTEGTFTYGYR